MSASLGESVDGRLLSTWRAVIRLAAWALFLCLVLLFAAVGRADAQNATAVAEQERQDAALFKYLNTPWRGDLDGMRTRRYIRILVTYSRTNYYLDGAVTKGFTAEVAQAFEKWLNRHLKTRKYPVHVVCIPVRRDELISALNAGRGDIAVASLSITPGREELVAFSEPWVSDVREVVVAGPESPELGSIEDLSGKEVYVRRSSSYFETLQGLNARLASRGLPPVDIRPADESLESEDIMEMVGAGLLPLTVVDGYRARLWGEVGVKVVPGGYLSATGADGVNPGADFIRIAMVESLATSREALSRLSEVLS